MVHQTVPFFNACYRHKDREYSRSVWQVCHHFIQVDNNNNAGLKFQAEQTERLEGHGIKITGRKQAQKMNTIFEGIYRRKKKPNQINEGPEIKLHSGSRNQRKSKNDLLLRMDFSTMGEFRYTQYQKRGGHCIHDPIHSDTDLKDETGVAGMETNFIIYINFAQFSSLSHSPTMAFRHRH